MRKTAIRETGGGSLRWRRSAEGTLPPRAAEHAAALERALYGAAERSGATEGGFTVRAREEDGYCFVTFTVCFAHDRIPQFFHFLGEVWQGNVLLPVPRGGNVCDGWGREGGEWVLYQNGFSPSERAHLRRPQSSVRKKRLAKTRRL